MDEGDLVVITGKLDTRVRQKQQSEGELFFGTLICLDPQKMAWVLLPDGDIWRGPIREICLAQEQTEVVNLLPKETAPIVEVSVSV
jgi:hypothetical protein